jgi:NAD+ synthase
MDLSELHDILIQNLHHSIARKEMTVTDERARMADANLRARLRMSTIYSYANALNYLVVGTDNMAELYTGYFTKYGDGAVDILPIANLLKREVRQWASVLGVPENVIKKAPSAGLWVGQTDEDEMGISYDIIDDYLSGKKVSEENIRIIERFHKNTQHKRETPPKPPPFTMK